MANSWQVTKDLIHKPLIVLSITENDFFFIFLGHPSFCKYKKIFFAFYKNALKLKIGFPTRLVLPTLEMHS